MNRSVKRIIALTALWLCAAFAVAQAPIGVCINNVFTLPQAPSPAASLRLYRGWQVLKAGGVDFTLSGATITYTIAPPPTATHLAFYRY